jgi:hypothetical protein
VVLLVLAHLTFSYYYFPWFFSALFGTVLILIFSYLAWGNETKFWIGLQIGKNEYLFVIVSFFALLAGSFVLIWFISQTYNVLIIPGNIKNFTHTFFYTLNEEIVVGAALLKGLKYCCKKTPDWMISVGVAIGFSVFHFIFFKWIFKNSGNLGAITLMSLFFAGIVRNNLILKTGHIAYSFSLHFAWIYVMLGSSHYNQTNKVFLNDFERFDIYLGDYRILIVCLILAVLSFFVLQNLFFTDKRHPVSKG